MDQEVTDASHRGPEGLLVLLICACCVSALTPPWLLLAVAVNWFDGSAAIFGFYFTGFMKTDLGKLQNFMLQMAESAAVFSGFVTRFRFEHIYQVLYEKHASRQAKIYSLLP